MPEMPTVGAFAIVLSNDLPPAIPFWERLGFASGECMKWGSVDPITCLFVSADLRNSSGRTLPMSAVATRSPVSGTAANHPFLPLSELATRPESSHGSPLRLPFDHTWHGDGPAP